MINHLERTHGIWFPKGGTGALVDALERLMREEGITITLTPRSRASGLMGTRRPV